MQATTCCLSDSRRIVPESRPVPPTMCTPLVCPQAASCATTVAHHAEFKDTYLQAADMHADGLGSLVHMHSCTAGTAALQAQLDAAAAVVRGAAVLACCAGRNDAHTRVTTCISCNNIQLLGPVTESRRLQAHWCLRSARTGAVCSSALISPSMRREDNAVSLAGCGACRHYLGAATPVAAVPC